MQPLFGLACCPYIGTFSLFYKREKLYYFFSILLSVIVLELTISSRFFALSLV